jgi:uncharacterized metal-binding protein
VRSKITSCLLPTTSQAWLHVVAAIFTIGPGTAAIMSTPRYIRKRNIVVAGYLYRITRIYVLASLLTLILGLIMTQLLHLFSDQLATTVAGELKTAAIERGRIASMSGGG